MGGGEYIEGAIGGHSMPLDATQLERFSSPLSIDGAISLYHQGRFIGSVLHNTAKALSEVENSPWVEGVEVSLARATLEVRTLTEALRILLEQTQKEIMK